MMRSFRSFQGFGGLAEVQRREFVSRAGLDPIIAEWSGRDRSAQLVRGLNAALSSLKKYTSTFSFDQQAADELFDRIETWQNANGQLLNQYVAAGAETVPQQVALSMGSDLAQQYIVASFAAAARGVKGWAGGAVQNAVQTGQGLSFSQADSDSEARLISFATIVKLDRDGGLSQIFSGQATNGFGLAFLAAVPTGAWWLLSAVAVATIASFALLNYSNSQNEYTNTIIEKLCQEDKGRCREVLEQAIAKRLDPESTIASEATSKILNYVGIGVVLFIGIKYVLPAAIEAIDSRKARQA